MMLRKLLSILLVAGLCEAFPRRPIVLVPSLVEKDKSSVDVTIDKNAFGTCSCDLTRNACDAYCCCDSDCGSEILDVWKANYDQICAKNYIGQAFKPAQRCIDSKQVYGYNLRMGMSVTDEQGFFCVEMDAASPTSTYQDYVSEVPEVTVLGNLEQFDMVNITYTNRGYSDRFGVVGAFNYLDEMLSLSEQQMIQNFMLPQRDLFGFCDNFKSASFLQDVNSQRDGSCIQQLTSLEQASATFLNPQTYFNSEYLLGSSQGSQSAKFSSFKVFKRSTDGEVTLVQPDVDIDAAGALVELPVEVLKPVFSGTNCSVRDYLSELLYRVYYTENNQGLYTIADIQIEFLLDAKLEIDLKYCTSGNQEAFFVKQKFGIEFVVARESSNGFITTLEGVADTGVMTRSGNPGYQSNAPLIVAEGESGNDSKAVSVLGFFVKGPDNIGKCVGSGNSSGPAQRLDFGKASSSACYVTFDTFADMESFCQSATARKELEIFNQFEERFKWVAAFGNPNVNFVDDWRATIFDETSDTSKAGTVDTDRQSCRLVSAYEIEILTSQLGYLDNVQSYIVGARIQGVEKEWVFEGDGAPENFSLYISITFSEVLPMEIEENEFVSFSSIKGSLFYPFNIRGGSMASVAWNALALATATVLLVF